MQSLYAVATTGICLLATYGLTIFAAPASVAAQEVDSQAREPRPRAQQFVEISGVQEFTSRLIVRPRQLRTLLHEGMTLETAHQRLLEARSRLRQYDVVKYVPQTDETILRIPEGFSEADLADALMATGQFEYIEPDWRLFPTGASPTTQSTATPHPPLSSHSGWVPFGCPNDPQLNSQWHHQSGILRSCNAWTLETGQPSIAVGVCDTGIRTTHEDLQLHRLEAYNAVDGLWESQGGEIGPRHFHGTRTTGVIAANGNNAVGIAGVGWDLSHRMIRVTNQSDGGAFASDIQHGARTSIESGDRVVNVSYHGAAIASNRTTASYIRSLGGLMLWSAGNSGGTLSQSDRDLDDLIVVGATTQVDTLASFSNSGSFVDLVAPGVGILTTDSGTDQDYAAPEGTSYACPMVAGVCAMIWSQRPGLSPTDVEAILKASCVDLGAPGVDNTFGYGRIDLQSALELLGVGVPQADLAAPVVSGTSPLAVDFVDLSAGVPSSWLWDFGDGVQSTEQNPAHTYTTAGFYSVSLTAENAFGSSTVSYADYVVVDLLPPIAEFMGTPTAGLAPQLVQFTDLSEGGSPTSWLWDFGDGMTAVDPNPAHTYSSAGFYTVSLTVSNSYGADTRVQTNYIAVDFIPPAADFGATPTAGNSPFVVDFADLSSGGVATSWTWSFGDGYSSTLQSPSHTYTVPGDYTVRLTATNAYGFDDETKVGYIAVGPGPPLSADFSGAPLTGTAPLQVTFTDLSIGHIAGRTWEFDDGTSSNEQHPVHTFTIPGEYNIALEVYNAGGSDASIEKEAYIVVQ